MIRTLLISGLFCTLFSCTQKEVIYVEANAESGYNYPYYLILPENPTPSASVHIVVEPNNSGFVSDDFEAHKKSAKKRITNEKNLGAYISKKLNYPILVPIFPRSESDWKTYTHALDRDVLLQRNNTLERIDLQLLNMIDHAKSMLDSLGIRVRKKIILTGFSASGTFVNRFTAIHPNRVQLTVAGGLNGILFFPKRSMDNSELNYPIGTNDFQVVFDKPFDFNSFKETPQYLFMGEKDDNDAVKYADAYSADERELIYAIIGKDMQSRWINCMKVYKTNGINATSKTYEDLGHEYNESIRKEILEFVKNNLE